MLGASSMRTAGWGAVKNSGRSMEHLRSRRWTGIFLTSFFCQDRLVRLGGRSGGWSEKWGQENQAAQPRYMGRESAGGWAERFASAPVGYASWVVRTKKPAGLRRAGRFSGEARGSGGCALAATVPDRAHERERAEDRGVGGGLGDGGD